MADIAYIPTWAGFLYLAVGPGQLQSTATGGAAAAAGRVMAAQKGVWITRRLDIARHWIKMHPYRGKGLNEEDARPRRAGRPAPGGRRTAP